MIRVTDKVVGDLLICGSEQFPYWAKGHWHIAPLMRVASEFSARVPRRRAARPDSDGQGALSCCAGNQQAEEIQPTSCSNFWQVRFGLLLRLRFLPEYRFLRGRFRVRTSR